jgi:hypothetical protein
MTTKNKRSAMARNPLDMLLSDGSAPEGAAETPAAVRASEHPHDGPPPRARVAKVRATFHLPVDLMDEARNAVVFLAGPPERLTLASLTETAIRRELERLSKKHHEGKGFPRRSGELKGGRPISS